MVPARGEVKICEDFVIFNHDGGECRMGEKERWRNVSSIIVINSDLTLLYLVGL